MSKRTWILYAVVFLVCITSVRTMIAPNDADSAPSLELGSQPRWNTYEEYTLRNRRWTYGTFDIPESAEKVRLIFDIVFTEGDPEYLLQVRLFQDGEDLWSDWNFYQRAANYTIEGINGEITFNVQVVFGEGTMTVEWFGVA